MIIVFHKQFEKDFKRLPVKTREKFNERLIIFGKDQFDPALNNHSLAGKYSGYRSINITGDLRAIYVETNGEDVIFVAIGSHSKLYG